MRTELISQRQSDRTTRWRGLYRRTFKVCSVIWTAQRPCESQIKCSETSRSKCMRYSWSESRSAAKETPRSTQSKSWRYLATQRRTDQACRLKHRCPPSPALWATQASTTTTTLSPWTSTRLHHTPHPPQLPKVAPSETSKNLQLHQESSHRVQT